MDTTDNLLLPYIVSGQAQKFITHNEALKALDAIVQLGVVSRTLSEPPASPVSGARYIVGPSATDAWSGKDGKVAAWQDGAWSFLSPRAGWLCWVAAETALLAWTGSAWTAIEAGGGTGGGAMVGINTTADTTNRLAVKSDAVLFANDDVTPGTGDMQLKLNKADPANTASVLFQTAYSGRAEFGLSGGDDFHVKVSADGTSWLDALAIKASTGQTTIGNASPSAFSSPKLSVFNANTAEWGNATLSLARSDGQIVLDIYNGNAIGWNAAPVVMRIAANSTSSRSINAAGTVNASGADYAEYETKAEGCGPLAKGQIVGFDRHGQLTDRWADAVAFGVKSTAPSFVGGDIWGSASALGLSPDAQGFEAALEKARGKVDRIAYSGKVPVNVPGAAPGDIIVAVRNGDGISGAPTPSPDPGQCRRAVGRVRRILPDGRAEIAVIVA